MHKEVKGEDVIDLSSDDETLPQADTLSKGTSIIAECLDSFRQKSLNQQREAYEYQNFDTQRDPLLPHAVVNAQQSVLFGIPEESRHVVKNEASVLDDAHDLFFPRFHLHNPLTGTSLAINAQQKKISRKFWKAGDYDALVTLNIAPASGIDHVRVHPKFLHSNATSHKWALGAIAELLDNAIDEVQNGATHVRVDVIQSPLDGTPMLLVQDDGGGMDPDCMRQCMSLGYSQKTTKTTIGQYGNGFKTSTMRLGADVIVFSRCIQNGYVTESIGLLSYTFLRETAKEDIIVPMVDFQLFINSGTRNILLRTTNGDWLENLQMILQWSPFRTEGELLNQFADMSSHGTKIIVYNLWLNDDGELELDFDTDWKSDPTFSAAPMASGEGQSNPSTSGDAGKDHHEDFGNEYGPPLPTQEVLREMEHRRLVGEATNLMLNFAKDPKLAKYMSETAFQDVQAQLKATTTSPPKPESKKQYLEKELEEELDARLARILGAQKQGKKHDRKQKKSTNFPGYLGSQSTFDKAKKRKKYAAVPSSSSSQSSSESSEEERRSKKRSRRHRYGKNKRKSRLCRADDSSTEDLSTDSSDSEDGHFYANKKNFYKANQYDFLEDKSKKVREFKEGGQSIKFETFSGYKDASKALSFIQQFDIAFAGGRYSEHSKIRRAASYLKGNARTWWSTRLLNRTAPVKWLKFKKLFISSWLTQEYERDIRAAWNPKWKRTRRSLFLNRFWHKRLRKRKKKELKDEMTAAFWSE
ncbi:hypothetical protein L7F22_061506 [Adiantum nelumboides]|nr:hypothetical protein [Adiantum nelumboides]